MEVALIWILVALSALSGLGVIAFQNPVRSAASFLVTLVCAATLLLALERPALSGLVLWVAGGGAGLVLLVTILLLNLSADEAGARRFSLGRLLALLLVGYFGAALFGILSDAVPKGPARRLDEGTLGIALFDDHGVALAIAFLGLATVVPAALVMARRKG